MFIKISEHAFLLHFQRKPTIIDELRSHAYTEKGYLPENFLPDFLDLVIWGHEHECLIDPSHNPETNFAVIQPGSSIATSLMPAEAVPKHVAVLSITGRDYKVEPIRLKTVRPFVMREIVLAEEKEAARLAKKASNRTELTRFLEGIVYQMIEEANAKWEEAQGADGELDDELSAPLPLIRLRVEFTPPEGGNFDCENPQRFSNRFVRKVANHNDVVQFHRRKAGSNRRKDGTEMPEESTLASLAQDSARVEKIIREFLTAQSLTILPQNAFSDAVGQFVDKDDRSAIGSFVETSLKRQVQDLEDMDHMDEDNLEEGMNEIKSNLEDLFTSGQVKMVKRKSRPDDWDSDLQGEWDNDPLAIMHSDDDVQAGSDDAPAAVKPIAKGRGKAVPTTKKTATAKSVRGKKKVMEESDEDDDVVMVDSDEDNSQGLFVKPAPATRASKKAAPTKKQDTKTTSTRTAPSKQSQLNFSQPQPKPRAAKTKTPLQISDDDISDDDDAFEPISAANHKSNRR